MRFFPYMALLIAALTLASLGDFPPRQNILQQFYFFSTGPLNLHFQDTFCPGLATLIWDNNVFLGTTPSLQNFCGISVRGDSSVIVSPLFTFGDYELAAGFHNLTVLVYGSPTPNGKATLQLTLQPLPGTAIKMIGRREEVDKKYTAAEFANLLPQPSSPPPTIKWIITHSPNNNILSRKSHLPDELILFGKSQHRKLN